MTQEMLLKFAVLSALIGLGVFLIIQFSLKATKRHFLYLTLFFLANLIGQIDGLFNLLDLWRYYPWLKNIYIPFLYLLAPLIYLYFKSLVLPKSHPNGAKFAIHWLGFALSLLICMPYYWLGSDIKLTRLLAPAGTLQHLSYVTFGPKLVLIGFIPFSFVYLFMILRQLSAHLTDVKAYFSNIENKDLSWLRWSIFILIFVLIIATIELLLPNYLTEINLVIFVSLGFEYVWIMTFAILAMRQNIIMLNKDDNNKPSIKYSRSMINQHDQTRIERKLIAAMSESKLHHNPSLTLRMLADHTGVTENRISQILNITLQQNFYDFINSWRVKDACILMPNSQENILSIAYKVGFNSRSTFNAAFKKHTGKTPTAYRTQTHQ